MPTWLSVDEKQLDAALAAFQSRNREAYEIYALYYVERLSYADIAELVGIPMGTVATRLHRARAQIKRCLQHVLDAEIDATRMRSTGEVQLL